MDIPYVEIVKDTIGSQAVDALRVIFESRKGESPSVPVQRFRADHDEWINTLDMLEGTYSLIERSRESTEYIIRPYALPLIGTSESEAILHLMDNIYERFSALYREHLSQPLGIDMLCGFESDNNGVAKEALYYLAQSHSALSGMTIGFPYADGSTLCISESVLSKKSIARLLSEYYEWHFINPRNQITSLESYFPSSTGQSSFFLNEKVSVGKPEWYEFLGETQKALILEIDCALNNNLEALPAIGLRTLLEIIMVEKIGDIGTFAKKVERFTQKGYVTSEMSETLSHVLDAGNASAHRAYFPSREI